MGDTLFINEIFYSIQGESTRAGLPCVLVRFSGCPLRCHYCDTEYAFHEGQRRSLKQTVDEVQGYGCHLVEITGGEPLLQPNSRELMTRLCDAGHTVLLETSGAWDISDCDARVIRIMDLKTPDSGEESRNLWSNIEHLTRRDEVKFVLASRRDYEWARRMLAKHDLADRTGCVLFSPVASVGPNREIRGSKGLSLQDLANWVLEDHLPVRIQTQLHKLIWGPDTRGV